jgi:hypothetical protein
MRIVLWIVLFQLSMISFFPSSMYRNIHWSHVVGVEAVLISKRQSPQYHDMVDESTSYRLHHRRTSRHRRWHEIQSNEGRNSIFLLMDEDGVVSNSKMNVLRGKGGDNGSKVGLHYHNETSNDSQEDSKSKNSTKGRSSNGSTVTSLIGLDSEDIEMASDRDDDMARDGKKKSPKLEKDHAVDNNSYSSGNFTWGKKANSQANDEDSEDFVFIPGSNGNIIDEVMTRKKRKPKGSKRTHKKATVKGTKREKKKKQGDDDDGNKSKQYRPMPSQFPPTDTYGPPLSATSVAPTNKGSVMTPDIPSKEESGMPTTSSTTSPLTVSPNIHHPFDSTAPAITPVIIATPYPSISSGYTPYPMPSQVKPPTQPKTLAPIERDDPNPLSLVPSSREPSLRYVTNNPSDITEVPSMSPTTLDSTDIDPPTSLAPSILDALVQSNVPSLKSPLPTFPPNRWKFLSEVPTKIPLLTGEPSIIKGSKKSTLSQFPTDESEEMESESPTEITTTAVTYAPICAIERDCGRSERPI